MVRRLIRHSFGNKFSIVALVGMSLLGCAGSTTVQRQHHLLMEKSPTVPCESVSRGTATEAASRLEAVEGAQNSTLAK